jgi:uncharacterized Fe-S cluster protein YjdI
MKTGERLNIPAVKPFPPGAVQCDGCGGHGCSVCGRHGKEGTMSDEANELTRRYTLDTLTVEWRAGLCVQCGNCKAGLPEVFDPRRRPWVDLSKASPEEILAQVARCPSGALQIPPHEGGPP